MKATLALLVLFSLTLAVVEAKETIFDDDHDFMKGFETGVMMRNSGSTSEEFGCYMPKSNWQLQNVINLYRMVMQNFVKMLPEDNDIETAFDLLNEYMTGFVGLAAVLNPDTNAALDDYCKGLLFG